MKGYYLKVYSADKEDLFRKIKELKKMLGVTTGSLLFSSVSLLRGDIKANNIKKALIKPIEKTPEFKLLHLPLSTEIGMTLLREIKDEINRSKNKNFFSQGDVFEIAINRLYIKKESEK